MCIALCTIIAHNIAQNIPDNFTSYPPDNHHCSDDVYLREGGQRAVIKDRVPISVVPRDQVPFSHLYMDVIGPLLDKAEYNFCLCLIDSHTRFPFAFPLRSVTAKAVCECLLQVFFR